MKRAILIITIVLAANTFAWAGDCSLDLDATTAAICNHEYVSGVNMCREMHPNALDQDNLAACLRTSRDVYKKCTGGCDGPGNNSRGSYAE